MRQEVVKKKSNSANDRLAPKKIILFCERGGKRAESL
jgi:hypothetical protein